ncbi:hypothetical protein HHK36_016106 [Tetracentron sinense]|uniref:Trichome birefringence-like N-terminal domain-containing protein n=1 Tax=Tetracentron sinense TaxID=13715 RepID=A0A834YWL0_TETSI|nr:hypothetical protein HHK36_016106 [Tetracentron sinense]
MGRFTIRGSTRKYSVRKTERVGRTPESDRRRGSPESCDVFSGKWVFDNTWYPLYNVSDCPYMSDQLACRKHGRWSATEIEGEETDVCRGFTEQRTLDIHGVFITVGNSGPLLPFSEQRWSNEENGICEGLDGLEAMELAMEAWADWVASKGIPSRSVSSSLPCPLHIYGEFQIRFNSKFRLSETMSSNVKAGHWNTY